MASNKKTKSRGAILGLALAAMLAFSALGAGAAQASPDWHVNGSQFLGKETAVTKGGPIRFELPWFAFTCQSVKSEKQEIFNSDEGSVVLELSNCGTFEDYPYCSVPTFWMHANVSLLYGGESTAYQIFTPALGGNYTFGNLKFTGEECSLSGSYPLRGSLSAQVGFPPNLEEEEPKGFEAVNLPLAFSPTADLEAGTRLELAGFYWVSVEGSASQRLSGALEGKPWGAY